MSTDNAHFDNNPKTDFTTPALTPQHAGYSEEDFGDAPLSSRKELISGNVITIMGIPKPDADSAFNEAIMNITDYAAKVFERFEIGHTPVYMGEKFDECLIDETGNPEKDMQELNTPIGRAAATLFVNVLDQAAVAEAEAERARYEALSPEERAAEDAGHRENARRIYREASEQAEARREQKLDEFFGVAQKWATLPDLTATERCHGVAHDFYLKYGVDGGVNPENGRSVDFNRSDDYGRKYDHNFADDIRTRQIRAAKELFGNV